MGAHGTRHPLSDVPAGPGGNPNPHGRATDGQTGRWQRPGSRMGTRSMQAGEGRFADGCAMWCQVHPHGEMGCGRSGRTINEHRYRSRKAAPTRLQIAQRAFPQLSLRKGVNLQPPCGPSIPPCPPLALARPGRIKCGCKCLPGLRGVAVIELLHEPFRFTDQMLSYGFHARSQPSGVSAHVDHHAFHLLAPNLPEKTVDFTMEMCRIAL